MKQKKDELGILSIVSDDQKTTRIVGSLPDIGTHKARKLNEDLNKFLTQFNKSNKKVFINGKAFLFDENVDNGISFVRL